MNAASRRRTTGLALLLLRATGGRVPWEIRRIILEDVHRNEHKLKDRFVNWEGVRYTSPKIMDNLMFSVCRQAPLGEVWHSAAPIRWCTFKRWKGNDSTILKGQTGTKIWVGSDEDNDYNSFQYYHLFSQYQVKERTGDKRTGSKMKRGRAKRSRKGAFIHK